VSDKKEKFETVLGRLEEIVEKMESPGLDIEESIALYEEGIKKAEMLNVIISKAREKVMKLATDKNGNPSLKQFDEEELL